MPSLPFKRTRALVLAPLATAGAVLACAPSALATYSGDNGRLAFHSFTDNGAQIFTVRPNGKDLRQITHLGGDALRPDWSPDGRRIAFGIETEDSGHVAVMNADGSRVTVLPTLGDFAGDPSFTPDGRRLVYGFDDPAGHGIASMKLDGSDQRVIKRIDAEDPNVSPDGRSLSLTCIQEPDVLQALCTFPVGGGAVTTLTPYTAEVGAKDDWAPDGRRLAYTDRADRPSPGDSSNVGTVRRDGTDARLLTHYTGGDVNAFMGSYSPDGEWIAMRLEDHGRFGLYKIRPDGTRMRAILPLSDFAPRFIDWGPAACEDDDR
jgi:Tol biopolymer transport system component